MYFSSATFVFAYLPIVLAVYFVLPKALRNAWLLVASLVFYAWEEPVVSVVLVATIVLNYVMGRWIERARSGLDERRVLFLAVAANLSLLLVFKYADWIWHGVETVLVAAGAIEGPPAPLGSRLRPGSWVRDAFLNADDTIRLPIGISFFTFQGISYVVDVHRRQVAAGRSLVDYGMYKAFFPQLVAGPIVRYRDIADQITDRVVRLEGFAYGVRRFLIGLAKKMLVADLCAVTADKVFALPPDQFTPELAWLGIVTYTLQIYFDFSGYSDIAIGIAHMFGFKFLENFRHPYVARSITDFWRRWHISLSSWFRDYLYIPLGGNRHGPARTYANLLVVFVLCGLWHGASLTFVAWGAYHGLFLVFERIGLGAWLERRGAWLQHIYVMLVVMVGWVFFRATDFHSASRVLAAMFGIQDGSQVVDLGTTIVTARELNPVGLFADARTWIAIAAGVVGSTPWLPALAAWTMRAWESGRTRVALALESGGLVALALLFVLCAMQIAAGSYSPFIYFRF